MFKFLFRRNSIELNTEKEIEPIHISAEKMMQRANLIIIKHFNEACESVCYEKQ